MLREDVTAAEAVPAPTPEELRALLRREESLRAVIESISSELELRPLLVRILRHACNLIGADNGTIGLVDPERGVIRTEAAIGMPDDEMGAEIAVGVGLFGRVLATGEPLNLSRYGDIGRPTQTGLLENSVVGVPIRWRGRLIGVFGIGSAPRELPDGCRIPARQFSDAEIDTLVQFARHAAIAIENARLFDGMQRALAEARLLYDTTARMSAAHDGAEVVAAYLGQVATAPSAAVDPHACTIALYERDPVTGDRAVVVVCGSCAPDGTIDLSEHRVPYTQDELDFPLDAGETVLIRDVHTDPRASVTLRRLQKESGRPALAFIPLLVRGERIGLVILSAARVRDWPEPLVRRYQITAAQLAATLDSRRQLRVIAERGQRLAVLEERHRLAQDLHDSVTQLLFGVSLIAQSLGPAWKRDPVEGERRIERLVELSRTAHAEMRTLLTDLRPETIGVGPSGLAEALRAHLTSVADPTGGLQSELDTTAYRPLSQSIEHALFRIAQEAIANVWKHAYARRVSVRLAVVPGGTAGEEWALLEVTDDGVGIAPIRRGASGGGGMGLTGMRDRAETLGGAVTVGPAWGGGTIVRVTIPVADT